MAKKADVVVVGTVRSCILTTVHPVARRCTVAPLDGLDSDVEVARAVAAALPFIIRGVCPGSQKDHAVFKTVGVVAPKVGPSDARVFPC